MWYVCFFQIRDIVALDVDYASSRGPRYVDLGQVNFSVA